MTAYDVAEGNGHITKAEVDAKLASYPEWERQARIYGLPAQGHGRIVQLPESHYVIEPIELRPWWPRIIGLDIGFAHYTAAVWLAWDRDTNKIYAIDEYFAKGLKISDHAGALILRGAGEIPVAWPPDAGAREHGTGESIAVQYRRLGVNMLPTHASNEATGNSLWASATDLVQRLEGGQIKIFSTARQLRNELMGWHQKDNRIVTENDDLVSAFRYGLMSMKKARVPDFSDPFKRAARRASERVTIAMNADLDPWWNLKN
jgi:hypothetical protein